MRMGQQCLFLLVIILSIKTTLTSDYIFPPYEIEVYSPKGFKISVPDSEGVTLFAVHININKELEYLEAGQIARDIVKKKDNRWVYENKEIRLHNGDKLYFWLYIISDRLGYRLDNQEYVVQGLTEKPSATLLPRDKVTTSSPPKECQLSLTTVSGKNQCKGDLLFFEQFDDAKTLGSRWSSEVQIPRTLESYFMVFDNKNRFIENGSLSIKPSLLEVGYRENFIKTGNLKLEECTADSRQNCEANGFSWNIIPPILSSRVNTKYSFNFKFGTVEVRAKLPKGDWIVPEIWLVGKDYGENSGKIIIARSFGNEDLRLYSIKIDGHLLNQGVCTNETSSVFYSKTENDLWSEDYHIYKIEWTPGYIRYLVDQIEVGRLQANEKLFDIGDTNLSPFDREFFISIGVHVGGLVDFPDDSINRGKPKPWVNQDLRNVLRFWSDKNNWFQTWSDTSKLLVDYIKVTAL